MMHHLRLKWRVDPKLWDALWKDIAEETVSFFSRSKMILDVGCGTSSFFTSLRDFQERVIGIDVNIQDLLSSTYQVVLASAHNLPFRREVFDGIHCRGAIHHLDIDLLFLELFYVSDGARILVLEPLAGVLTRLVRSFVTTDIHAAYERPLNKYDVRKLDVFIDVTERKYLFGELSYLLPFILPLLPDFFKRIVRKIALRLNPVQRLPPFAYIWLSGIIRNPFGKSESLVAAHT